jgi:Cd2+/Zn2+-exporting ATPase
MDKTGTLTEGRFEVSDMHAIGCTEEELLEFAAVAETFSNHPVAMSIKEAYNGSIDASDVTESDNLPGRGVRVVYKGKEIHAGNIRLMQDLGYEYCDEPVSGTSVHIAIAGGYKGHITCSDVVKEDTAEVIARMKAAGIKKTVMLSGDAQIVADTVGKSLGIDEIQAELLPADKTEHLKRIMEENSGKTVFVGDGINDAPSLTMADVGIAMGAMGSDAAIEAADLVIMDDDLGKIPDAIALSHKVNRIVMENIVFALAIKFLLLGLATFGIANMWMAVFGDVGVSVIAILNAMRCMKMAKTRARKPSDKASAAG